MSHGVAVTGIGVLTAAGSGIEAFSDALKTGRTGITSCTEDGLGVAGRLRRFDFEKGLAELPLADPVRARALRAGRKAPRSAQAGLLAALEAWQRAFGGAPVHPPEEVNLVVAGNNLNQGYQRGIAAKFGEDPGYVPASYALHFLDTDQVGLVSEVLGVRGEGFTVGGGSASGNMGLLQAARQIRQGLCRACVVVGAMTDLSPVELQAFRHAGALGGKRFASQPEKACRPFDADREGFIYGQGSACLVLEPARGALDRGAPIWGWIEGAAACLDGNRSSNPSAEGEARAMRRALEEAGCAPEEVDYVNAHGTSSVLGDEVEARALGQVFGPHLGNVAVNATKGLVGHCLSAAGVVEAAATLLQMKGGFLHPNANLETPIDGGCRFVGPAAEARRSRLALSNSFGFGGINTSLVIRPHSGEASLHATS